MDFSVGSERLADESPLTFLYLDLPRRRRFFPRCDKTYATRFFPQKPTPRIDHLSCIAATSPARKSDLITTFFGMNQFNEFASRFRLAVTNWCYANALPEAFRWPAGFNVFAQPWVSNPTHPAIARLSFSTATRLGLG